MRTFEIWTPYLPDCNGADTYYIKELWDGKSGGGVLWREIYDDEERLERGLIDIESARTMDRAEAEKWVKMLNERLQAEEK